MKQLRDQQPTDVRSGPEDPARQVGAPMVPEELVNGDWRRRLVLPNQDGQLRLTPVQTAPKQRLNE